MNTGRPHDVRHDHHGRNNRRRKRQGPLRGRYRDRRGQDHGDRRPQPSGDAPLHRRLRPSGLPRLHRHALALRPHADRRPQRREQGLPRGYHGGRRQLQLLSFPGRPAWFLSHSAISSVEGRLDMDRPRRIRRIPGVGRDKRKRREPGRPLSAAVRRRLARQPAPYCGRARHYAPPRRRIGRARGLQLHNRPDPPTRKLCHHRRAYRNHPCHRPVRGGLLRQPCPPLGR